MKTHILNHWDSTINLLIFLFYHIPTHIYGCIKIYISESYFLMHFKINYSYQCTSPPNILQYACQLAFSIYWGKIHIQWNVKILNVCLLSFDKCICLGNSILSPPQEVPSCSFPVYLCSHLLGATIFLFKSFYRPVFSFG